MSYKIKCPVCFANLEPWLNKIGALEDLRAGNYVLCAPGCGATIQVSVDPHARFVLEKIESQSQMVVKCL